MPAPAPHPLGSLLPGQGGTGVPSCVVSLPPRTRALASETPPVAPRGAGGRSLGAGS